MWIIIAVIVIIAILIGLGWVVLTQRQAAAQAVDFSLAKKALMDEDIATDLAAARKVALAGQALQNFQETEKIYRDLRNHRFAAIDAEINRAMQLSAGLNVWKSRKSLQSLLDQMTEAVSLQKQVVSGLESIQQENKMQRQAIDQLHGDFDDITERLTAMNNPYGPSAPALLAFLSDEEDEYQRYHELIEAGDRVKAAQKFEEVGMIAGQVLDYMQNLPILFTAFNEKYLDQINELHTSWLDLTDRGVVFVEGVLEDALSEVDDLRLQGLQAIEGLKVKEANTISTTLNQKIQDLYDLMEEEYQAYHRYFKQQERVNTEFDRVKEQNHSLLLELTYLKGRFILGHEEEDRQSSYHHDIEELVLSQQEVQRALKEGSQTYSWAVTRQENWLSILSQLDSDQVALYHQIEEFQPALQSAKEHTTAYIDQIRGVKRSLERRDLPGLPEDFLQKFFTVSDEITRLDEAVYAGEVDLDDVQRQLNIVAADFDTLKEQAHTVIVAADLAVSLLQYANRYREQNEEVAKALKVGQKLYQVDFDYDGVIQEMKLVLQEVEPGAFERLQKNQDPVLL